MPETISMPPVAVARTPGGSGAGSVRPYREAGPGAAPGEAAAGPTERHAASPWRWVTVLVLFAVVVTGFFDRISIAVLFTDHDFNAALGTAFQPATLGLLMTGFLLSYAVSSILLSFVGDLWGPRRAMGLAAGLWGIMMMLMGACSSYSAMMAYRVVLGLSEGPQFSLVSKTVQRWFPPREQARANAIWMVGSPIGSAIGFPLTFWLVSHFGWRASFYVLGALSLTVVMPLVFAVIRDRPPHETPAPQQRSAPAHRFRREDVFVLVRDHRVWLLTVYGCGLLTYLWGLNSWLPTYLERSRHFDLHQLGIYSSLPFVLMFVGEVASGFISDRTGRRAILSIVGLLGAGILMYIGTVVSDPRLAAIVIALSAGSWGLGLPTHYAMAMRIVPSGVMSTGIGMINGIANLVGAFAPALIGAVVAHTGSFSSGLLVIVIAAIAGSLTLLPLVRSY
jgi:sugar phosphate permease